MFLSLPSLASACVTSKDLELDSGDSYLNIKKNQFILFCIQIALSLQSKELHMKEISWGFIGCGEVTEKKSGPAFNEVVGSHIEAARKSGRVRMQNGMASGNGIRMLRS